MRVQSSYNLESHGRQVSIAALLAPSMARMRTMMRSSRAAPMALVTVATIVFPASLFAFAAPAIAAGASVPSFVFEAEGGPVWQTVNDVQIPNNHTATRFSLIDVIGHGPWPAVRLYATWNLAAKHGIRLLLAPLRVTETGSLESTVVFEGTIFDEIDPVEATYKFNSWRATYRYRVHSGARWDWWIGFTAKIRDAKIRLDQGTDAAEKTDLGFVPLLHVAGACRFADRWGVELDLDALAGGPGRAEDGALKLRFHANDRWSIAAGYRTLEGGADVDEVYNFAWLHYAVASVAVEL